MVMCHINDLHEIISHKRFSTCKCDIFCSDISGGNDNPVFYVQYAYTRIRSLFRKYPEFKEVSAFKNVNLSEFDDIITQLIDYPFVISEAASKRLPHRLAQYAFNLASSVHSYYNDHQIITNDSDMTNEKLTIMKACEYVLKDSLNLIGVKVKEKM